PSDVEIRATHRRHHGAAARPEGVIEYPAHSELLATLKRRRLEIQRQSGDQMTVKEWLAIRKQAALKIDPETAEVTWVYAEECDAYGVHPDLPAGWSCVSRAQFARSPGSDVWVDFGDLLAATRDALWERRR